MTKVELYAFASQLNESNLFADEPSSPMIQLKLSEPTVQAARQPRKNGRDLLDY